MKPAFTPDPFVDAHIRLHRLVVRLMVLHDRSPAYVEDKLNRPSHIAGALFGTMEQGKMDKGDHYTCMVRKQAVECGLPERRFQLYPVSELKHMARHVVCKIAALGESDPSTKSIAPGFPNGWQDSMRDVCDEEERLPTREVMADAGAM